MIAGDHVEFNLISEFACL